MVQCTFPIFKILAAGLIAFSAFLPVSARAVTLGDMFPPDAVGCFVARYDGKHLARNPKQRISALRISTNVGDAGSSRPNDLIMLDLDITLRNAKQQLKTVGLICFKQDDHSWRCNEHTCNGRPIDLKIEGAETILLDLRERESGSVYTGSLMLQSACGIAEKGSRLTLGSGDQIFQLKRSPLSACR